MPTNDLKLETMKDDASIDCDALDVEWIRHPGLVANVCGQIVDLRRSTDDAKDEMERVESQIEIDARDSHSLAMHRLTVLDHRRAALENMLKLLGAEYFAGPKVARDLNSEMSSRNETREVIKKAAVNASKKRRVRKVRESE